MPGTCIGKTFIFVGPSVMLVPWEASRLVAVGSAKLLGRLRDDIQRLAQLNANITVVTVESGSDASAGDS